MIIGGAQENTLLTCRGLIDEFGDDVLLITGPSLGPEGSLLEQARAAGVPLKMIPALRREIHPLRDWQAYRAIKQALRDFQPEVVHTHSAKGGMLGRLAASRLKIPVIVHTVHGAPFHPYQGRAARTLFRTCERYAARRCHALVSVADAMTDLMVDAGVAPRDKFATIYSGMDIEPFLHARDNRDAVRRELGYSDQHIVVAKVARLFHLKGHQYLLEAAPRIVEQDRNIRFLLIGDGILKTRLQQQIADLGLNDYFRFTGLVPPERVPALVGASDIVAHLSLREGLARVLPQALLTGAAVVSYDIDGAREVVRTGETGFLLPPRSIDPLVAAVDELVRDPALRHQLADQGRKECQVRFDAGVMVRQLRDLYVQLRSKRSLFSSGNRDVE
jgi:glycosyltransferase involved in cell wall biosynthesis